MNIHMLVDLAPFVMVTCIVGFFFTYKVIQMLVYGKQPSKKERRKMAKHANQYDHETVEDLVDRAISLAKRVQTLEEIIMKEREKK